MTLPRQEYIDYIKEHLPERDYKERMYGKIEDWDMISLRHMYQELKEEE